MRRFRPSPAMFVAVIALVVAMGGSAVAATKLLVHTNQIANGAVTSQKLAKKSVGYNTLNARVKASLAHAGKGRGVTGATGPQGPKGDTGATGAQGPKGDTGAAGAQGATGATGAQGPQGTPGTNGANGTNGTNGGPFPGDSAQTCAADLCLDAAPGPNQFGNDQGSAGFGYDSTAQAPVTSLTVGDTAPFTVTALQPNDTDISGNTRGQVTITYDTDYLQYVAGSGGANCVDRHSDSDTSAGWIVCDDVNFTHTDQSVGVQFKALAATTYTQVNDSVTTGGEEATQVVPIAVVPGS